MLERSRRARLLEEALAAPAFGREMGWKDLERDPPPEAAILGEVDLAHRAGAEHRDDAIRPEVGSGPQCFRHERPGV